MKAFALRGLPVMLALGLVACGPPKKSVFPPVVTIQELHATPGQPWRMVLRVQNNSFGEMDFSSLDATVHVGDEPPLVVSKTMTLDIPAFAADVIEVQLNPTAPMSAALAAVAVKGSAGSLPYRIDGWMSARPEQEKKQRPFPFQAKDWLSPVPGIENTYR
jgi:hypothetical protein